MGKTFENLIWENDFASQITVSYQSYIQLCNYLLTLRCAF